MFRSLFWAHDLASDVLAKYLVSIKRSLLVVAHISLLGIFVPEWQREYGNFSGNLLIIILFISPLSKMTRMRFLLQLMGFRRELGILMGYTALVHGLGYMIAAGTIVLPILPAQPTLIDMFLFSGSLGLFLLLPLLITSNVFSIRWLGKYWKRVHFLVYPAFLFIVVHRFIAGADRELTLRALEAIVLLGSYIGLKIFAWKPFFPLLSKLFSFVADQYRIFQAEKNHYTKII